LAPVCEKYFVGCFAVGSVVKGVVVVVGAAFGGVQLRVYA